MVAGNSWNINTAYGDDDNNPLEGYSGSLLEDEFCPTCKRGAWFDRSKPTDDQYMPRNEALYKACQNQPDDWLPNKPDPGYGMGKRLHNYVAKELGVDPSDVFLYTARKSAADILHGVDAFFFHDRSIVTIDLKLNGGMRRNRKADITMDMHSGSDEELMGYAADIAMLIKPRALSRY